MVALLLSNMLEELGCVVIGPFPDCASGMAAMKHHVLDGAVLDANLGKGFTSAPVAAALKDASVPFMVATGYGALALSDEALDRAPRITKPFDAAELSATALATFVRPHSEGDPSLS
jgi:DNA-binding LytR/AlgR family response regulator